MVFVVRFGAGKARRYLARAETTGAHQAGWRPFVWVDDIQRAELFSSSQTASDYALANLGHAEWEVGVAPSRGVPTDDLGGTPAAVRLAA